MNSFRGRISHSKIVRLKKVLMQLSECLNEEINNLIDEEQFRPQRLWVRKRIRRRETRGASALLLKELSVEDPQEYRLCLRLTPERFETSLNLIAPVIQRTDTKLRDAIPARVKVEVTLNFLATGNSYRILQHLFHVPKPSVSKFVPEVCEAIFEALKDFIKVCKNQLI